MHVITEHRGGMGVVLAVIFLSTHSLISSYDLFLRALLRSVYHTRTSLVIHFAHIYAGVVLCNMLVSGML